MDKDFYKEKYALTDMLLSTNVSKTSIAKELGVTVPELNKRIKEYNLDWITDRKRKMSRGQSAIVDILRKILPNEKIDFEHHIGERLRLDIYVPAYELAIEYHGRQHFEWVPFFHEDPADFQLAVARDQRKADLCKKLGITLVVFRYNDSLDETSVFNRILTSVRATEYVKKETPQLSDEQKEFRRKVKESRARMRKDFKKQRTEDVEYQQQQSKRRKELKQARREWERRVRRGDFD